MVKLCVQVKSCNKYEMMICAASNNKTSQQTAISREHTKTKDQRRKREDTMQQISDEIQQTADSR
jgi:hypothetical protein